jgi:hypothetical protein
MPPWQPHMLICVGLSSSARRGAERGASGLARTARPRCPALRRLPPPASPDREAAGSGGCSSTFHGRLGAGVTISIDAVPAVFASGLLNQHPICYNLFNAGRGMQVNSNATTTAAAATARSAKAVQQVYERFETAYDDLDSGLFDLDQRHCYCCMQFFAGAGGSHSHKVDGHVWCRACSYQVHGDRRGNGGQHREFADTARPNDRCAGCRGCTALGNFVTAGAHAREGHSRLAPPSNLAFYKPQRLPSPAVLVVPLPPAV